MCGHTVLYDTATHLRQMDRRSSGQLEVLLELVVIQTELLEETVKFTQLLASPEDFMNPDMTAGGFPAFLGLVQQVQCSNGGDISHDRCGKRAG